MSENAGEPPVVGLDRAQAQTYAQAAMALGWMLRERRQERGRRAWSDAEDVARAHDELEYLASTPPVRQLSAAEARETMAWADSRSVTNERDELRVRIRPTAGGARWILAAEIEPLRPSGDPGERVHAQISCDTEARARDLADELTAAGPDRALLARLGGHTQHTERHRRVAREEVSADRELWLEQVAEAAHEAWTEEIAERVVESEAFGALARHARTLAERGYEPVEVLGRIKATDLARADDAGALAAWFAKKLTQQLVVVEGEPGPRQVVRPAPDVGPDLRDVPRDGVDLAAAETLVRRSVPDIADRLVACPAWPSLGRTLSEGVRDGAPMDRMLAGLPQEAIAQARKPAAYATHLLRQAQHDQDAAAARGHRPWPPSPRPRREPETVQPQAAVGDLDPASAVDRVRLDAERPGGGPVDPAAAASHTEAAQDAAAAADRTERAAGDEHAHPDMVDGVPVSSGADQTEEAARGDDNAAAAYRAAAAEEHSAAAAALRAEVPLTPASGAARATTAQHGNRSIPPRAAPARTPSPQRRRHR